MTFFNHEDLLFRWTPFDNITSVELIGEVKTVGHILINNQQKIGIWIADEEKIMDELELFVRKFPERQREIQEAFKKVK